MARRGTVATIASAVTANDLAAPPGRAGLSGCAPPRPFDELRRPVAAHVERLRPLDECDARTRRLLRRRNPLRRRGRRLRGGGGGGGGLRRGHKLVGAAQPRFEPRTRRLGLALHTHSLAHLQQVVEHVIEPERVERDDARLR